MTAITAISKPRMRKPTKTPRMHPMYFSDLVLLFAAGVLFGAAGAWIIEPAMLALRRAS
jgi:hypothetical protein